MKYWCSNMWADSFDHEGLLFFCQKLQEMLFHFSDDIHRAPVHNTCTLANEFLSTYREVVSGKVKSYQLKAIFDELCHSFTQDLILKNNLTEEYMTEVHKRMKGCKEEDYFDIVNYVYRTIKNKYYAWIVEYLREHIPEKTNKKEIEFGVRCWVSDIIMRGYSGEFIYGFLESSIINQKVESIDILDAFFGRFDFKKKEYKVYFNVTDIVAKYADMLKVRLGLTFEDDGNFGLIKQLKRCRLCYLEVSALDHYMAAGRAYNSLNIFLKYYRLLSDKRTYMLNRMGYVFEIDTAQIYSLPVIPTGLKAIEIRETEFVVDTLDEIVLGLQDRNAKGVDDLNKAIDLHNNALRQQQPKDSLTNLWSVLEVLCPKREPESQLKTITRLIMPVLQKDYFHGVLYSIFKDLNHNLKSKDFVELFEAIGKEEPLRSVAEFCLLPQYEKLRETYFEKMSKFPLLRHKIYSLYQLRNDRTKLYELSKGYAQRVEWHLYRLYRARNAIVHAGGSYPRIQLLSEHLHSYVDGVIYELAYKLSQDNHLSDVNSIFMDTQLLVDSLNGYFKEAGAITATDIERLQQEYFVKIEV